MTSLAALDVGTNSVLLLVAEVTAGGRLQPIEDRAVVSRLGQGLVPGGRLRPQAAERTAAVIAELAARARQLGAADIRAVGTMGLRLAADAGAFIERVGRDSGVVIRVISGDGEARLTYRGAQHQLPAGTERLVVCDVGGGSTEVITGRAARIEQRCSLELGAVGLTERFLPHDPIAAEELAALRRHLAARLAADLEAPSRPFELVAVGGTATSLAAMHHRLERYDAERVHGTRLSRRWLADRLAGLARLDAPARARIRGLEPGRADIIPAGTIILLALLERLGAASLLISDRGLRHGLLLEAARDLLAGDG